MTDHRAVLRSPSISTAIERARANSTASTTTLDDRSSSRLAAEVERALFATGYPSLRHVRVVDQDRLVVIEGRVPTYHMKQVAQVAALAVPGVEQVCNELEVVPMR